MRIRVEYHGQIWWEDISLEQYYALPNFKSIYDLKDIRRSSIPDRQQLLESSEGDRLCHINSV